MVAPLVAPVNQRRQHPRVVARATVSLATRSMPSRNAVTSINVGGQVERGELVAGQGLVQVVDRGWPGAGLPLTG